MGWVLPGVECWILQEWGVAGEVRLSGEGWVVLENKSMMCVGSGEGFE